MLGLIYPEATLPLGATKRKRTMQHLGIITNEVTDTLGYPAGLAGPASLRWSQIGAQTMLIGSQCGFFSGALAYLASGKKNQGRNALLVGVPAALLGGAFSFLLSYNATKGL